MDNLSDNMVSCKIALADGSIIRASQSEHTDLFWAIRGAGHNFGIVLEATFQVYNQDHSGIHHNWDFEFRVDQARDVFGVLNRWVGEVHPNLAIFVLWKSIAASGAKVSFCGLFLLLHGLTVCR
jgi:FAD/FMN-containing dehydrogenase